MNPAGKVFAPVAFGVVPKQYACESHSLSDKGALICPGGGRKTQNEVASTTWPIIPPADTKFNRDTVTKEANVTVERTIVE